MFGTKFPVSYLLKLLASKFSDSFTSQVHTLRAKHSKAKIPKIYFSLKPKTKMQVESGSKGRTEIDRHQMPG